MIEMVCFDLDGTLLNGNSQVTQPSIQIIKQLLDQNIVVAIVTGRPMFYAKWVKEQIDDRVIVIGANGGDFKIDQKKVTLAYDYDSLQKIVDYCEHRNIMLYMYSSDTIYTKKVFYHEIESYTDTESLELFPDIKRVYDDQFKEALRDEITLIYVNSMDEKTFYESKEFLDTINQVEYGVTGLNMLDLNPTKVNKGSAVLKIASQLNINPLNIMAFGDTGNDVSMFKVVGHPVAMANAYDFVKEESRYITTHDHKNDGIVRFINDNQELFTVSKQ